MALRDISRRRSNSVAFGAKRASVSGLQNGIYEYAPSGSPMTQLILKRGRASRSSGQWSDEDYDVLADGKVVGRIYGDESASIVRAGSLVGACRA